MGIDNCHINGSRRSHDPSAKSAALHAGRTLPFSVRKFTVEEYHQLIEAGVLKSGEPFELLEGWIVRKMIRKPPDDTSLGLLDDALRASLPAGFRLRIQSAVTTMDSEPEPDVAVVRGDARTYVTRHPGAEDTLLLVEVADSTLNQDRNEKARIYARAGFPVYWIVNLVDSQVEVNADPTGPDPTPRYRLQQIYGTNDAVLLVIDGQTVAQVPVRDILP